MAPLQLAHRRGQAIRKASLFMILVVLVSAVNIRVFLAQSTSPAVLSTVGPQNTAVILVEFPDVKHAVSRDEIVDRILVQLDNYIREQSYNKTWIEGHVTRQWYVTSRPYSNYAYERYAWGDLGQVEKDRELVREAVRLADDEINYREYPHVIIVHPVNGSYSGVRVWNPDMDWIISVPTKDGVTLKRILLIPERGEYGKFYHYVHEFIHLLGLPDLYDAEAAKTGGYIGGYVGEWDPMSYPASPFTSYMPSGLMAWSRVELKWISSSQIVVVNGRQPISITLDPLEQADGILVLKIPVDRDRYYLVENRQPLGFDKYLQDKGLLVSLVYDDVYRATHEYGKKGTGRGPVRVVDSCSETSTLNDATFDLRTGKQVGFFDRKNDLSIVIAGRSSLAYTIFVGPVSQGEVILKRSEEVLAAMQAIEAANASIQRAMTEGRTEGIDRAKELVANSSAALDQGDYDAAMTLAQQASELASKATAPQATASSSAATRVTSEATSASPVANVIYGFFGLVIVVIALAIFLKQRRDHHPEAE